MSEMQGIFDKIDSYGEEVIKIQSALTSKAALGPENGGTGEHEKAAYIKSLLEAMRPETLKEIKAPDGRAKDGYRPNIIARWEGSATRRTVWVLSHSDIVPPGDLSLWENNPYMLKVEGDRIIGRGVEDNQHGFVSSYLGLKAILETGDKRHGAIGLAIVADEETGSEFGLDYILKNHGDIFQGDDLIVVPDGGNEDGTMIEVAEKSMLWMKFTVLGRQCHASTPAKGKNSLYGSARLILALEELKRQFENSDELFSPPTSTFEATKMEANVPNVNTIPGKGVFYLDCRILPEYDLSDIIRGCERIAQSIAEELGLKILVEPSYQQVAAEPTPADAPVVKALTRAIREVTGRAAKPMGIGGGTVAAFFRKAGLPAAVWSTVSDTAHQPNEYCLISDILTDAKIFACLYLEGDPGGLNT